MARGRVSVNSLEQAYLVLRKIINYERDPVINTSFYQTSLNCAYFQDRDNPGDPIDGYDNCRFVHTIEEVRDYLISKGKTVNRVYSTDDDVYPRYYNKGSYSNGQPIPAELRKDISPFYPWKNMYNSTDITNEINDGRFYVLHRGHGNYYTWAQPHFSTLDIPKLTNGNKLPVVFSLNCQTGGYLQPECFAEKFIRHPQGGAVGVFAASQISYSGYNDALVVGMFDAIWSNPGLIAQFGSGGYPNPNLNSHPDIYKMGHVLNQGLLRMTQTWGSSSYRRYQNEIFHYFGDPSMEIYTASPSKFTNSTVSQSGTTVTVNTGGISGCTIALTSMDYGTSYFDVAPNVSSHTFTGVTIPYYVTITKHNYIPYTYPEDDVYIQNVTITNDSYISGRNIYVGRAVTTATTQGDVIINNNANVIFDATQNVVLDAGFECTLGSTFEVVYK